MSIGGLITVYNILTIIVSNVAIRTISPLCFVPTPGKFAIRGRPLPRTWHVHSMESGVVGLAPSSGGRSEGGFKEAGLFGRFWDYWIIVISR